MPKSLLRAPEMETIHSSFEKCSKLFTEIVEEGGDESQVLSSIAAIESCLDMVRKSDVYSKGEELEEYSTQSLKVRIISCP